MSNKKYYHKEKDVRAVLAISIVLLAFMIFMFFNIKQEELRAANTIKQIVVLITIALGLLVGIMYLAGREPAKVSKKSTGKRKR